MRIVGMGFNPYQASTSSAVKKEDTPQISEKSFAVQGIRTSNTQESTSLPKEEKVENFKNYMLDRYKEYGLTVSGGPLVAKHGIAPSFSVDPRILEQAANNPEKAKELDSLINGLTTMGTNLFNAINNPPDVKMSMSVHINADGSRTVITRKEYSSLEAKKKYSGFDFNSFLDEQEELLESPTDFDYEEAIGKKTSRDHIEDIAEARYEDRKWMKDFRDGLRMEEWIADQNEEKYFLQQQQQKHYFDQKI